MGIQVTTGIASGIDYEELIQATLDVDRVPIDSLETEKQDYETTISSYGTIKSALSDFEDSLAQLSGANDLYTYNASSGDEGILGVTASDGASTGTYQIEVKQIAQAEVMIGYDGFTSVDATIGTGTLSIGVGGEVAVDITIDEEHSSLQNLAEAINEVDAGVSATVIETDEGHYALSLTAVQSGKEISFCVTEDGDGNSFDDSGLSRLYADPGLSEMDTIQEGTTAIISYGNMEIERSTNEIEGLIKGVTLNLNTAEIGTWVTVQVERSQAEIQDKIQSVVDDYNALMDNFESYQDEEGILSGDSFTRGLKANLQQSVFTMVETDSSNINTLHSLGVTLNDEGNIEFNTSEFDDVLENDEDAVIQFFADEENGFVVQVEEWLENYTESYGLLDTKIDGIETSIARIDERVEELERRLELEEERLREHYATLESTLSALQSTQEALTSLLSSLETSD